jgi:hypothetical protein
MKKLFNKLFLIREIKSKEGKVHFRRYRFLATPWLNVYVHQICRSDREKHMHDHPWDFITLILWRGYIEFTEKYPKGTKRGFLHIVPHKAEEVHQFALEDESKSTWTFVITGSRRREWGYQTESGWFSNETYRILKEKNEL